MFVCDNLAFSGEHVVRRKHTAKAKHEVPALVSELVEPLQRQREAQRRTLLTYQRTPLSDRLADHAIMRMYKEDVINVNRIPDVLDAWEHPPHDWGEKRVWRLFNAATYALDGRVAEEPSRTADLHHILDDIIEME